MRPVENPSQVCSAYSDGCGRPSIQMTRSSRPNTPSSVYAISVCVTGSLILLIRMFGPGPRMKYCAGCGFAICSGSERMDASQLEAFWRTASLIGRPV